MNRRERLKRELTEMLEMVKSFDVPVEPAVFAPEPIDSPVETPSKPIQEAESQDSHERDHDHEQPKKKAKKA